MSIKLEIKELAKIKDSEIELKPFTIFFGESNTNKSYTLIASYFWYKLVNGEDKELLEEIIENLKVEIKELSFEEFRNKVFGKVIFGLENVIQTKEKIFEIKIKSDFLKEVLENTFKKKLQKFFKTLVNNTPNLELNIILDNYKKNIGAFNIFFYINEENYGIYIIFAEDYGIYSLSSRNFHPKIFQDNYKLLNIYKDKYKNVLFISISKIIFRFLNMSSKTKLYFFPPSRSSIIDLQNSILLMSASDIPYPGLIKEFLKTYLPDVSIFSNVNNYTEDKTLAELIKEIYQGSIEFNIQTRETTYQQENLKIPILATASSIKELTPLYFALKHNPINEKIFFIEEPEAHLHPELQVKVAYLLSYIVNKGGKVNITTHSDYLVNALGTLVKLWYLKDLDYKKTKEIMEKYNIKEEYLINPENLGVYYFEKQKDNSIKIKEIKPDKYGIYPKSFEKVMERDLNISEEIELALLELKRKR